MVEPYVVPGVSTEALDRICHDHIVIVQGVIPANVGYQGYPKTILTSVNHVVCHGIPSHRYGLGMDSPYEAILMEHEQRVGAVSLRDAISY